MDDDALRQAFAAHTAGCSQFTRRHVINLADFFGVSHREIVRACERLGLTKSGSWEWFRANGGITKDHVRQAREDRPRP